MTLKENKEYFGKMIHNWTNEYKNKYVITGLQQGGANFDKRVGRVAQVRLEAGDFGSDNVLLRHCDGTLQQHTNQSFWLIPDKFTEYLNECFKDVYLDDSDKQNYTLEGQDSERGFTAILGKISEL
ncbi:hypothetical protein [Flammeovirga sp. SJP92]|uniref:hypothetical protein n=1 Tax=Flammeovirga sp. SJP92 TaxID=1775430 RepID=UPI00078726F9|nr:hypothetical protein [Flammeovirga sp. SJP92]KXX72751.1 hypothetical protein AVL50_32135 [Flammeovirga sp. SJP92]